MRLGVSFIAPRQLGAVGTPFGRQFLPSVRGRTGLSSVGAPDGLVWGTELLQWLSGGAPDYLVHHTTERQELPTKLISNGS